MLPFALADLRASRRLWLPALVALTFGAACAGGVCIAVSTGLRTAAAAPAPDAIEGVRVLGGTVCLLTVIAAAGVLGTTSGMALAAQSREHALWLLIGFSPSRLRWTLRAQIGALAVAASILAVPLSPLAAAVVLRQWSSMGIIPSEQLPILEVWQPLAVAALTLASAGWGCWGVTRRASRISEMSALRESRAPRPAVTLINGVISVMLLLGAAVIIGAVTMRQLGGADDRAAGALCALLMLILATLLVPAWTLRPLLWVWTAMIPSRSLSWRLARAGARFASARTFATIVPFAIGSSLLAVLHGGGAISGGGTTLAEVGVLIGPTLAVAWVGAICAIALVGRSRRRDQRLLATAGATTGLLRRTACLEGAIYAMTALAHGACFLVAAVVLIRITTGISLAHAATSLPWGTFGGFAALTLVTAVGAVLLTTTDSPRGR